MQHNSVELLLKGKTLEVYICVYMHGLKKTKILHQC